jgi:hypothetical protein
LETHDICNLGDQGPVLGWGFFRKLDVDNIFSLETLSYEFVTVEVTDSPGLNQGPDIVLLVPQGLVLESEPGGIDVSISIERDVSHKLFSANTEVGAAVALDLDVDEHLHLAVEVKNRGSGGATGLVPGSGGRDEVGEGGYPGVDRGDNCVLEF